MSPTYRRAAFLFRRDLRLDDNTGLARAAELAAEVMPCFVFDPRQQAGASDYFGAPAFQFLIESLEDLERRLAERGGALYRFLGDPAEVVGRLIGEAGVDGAPFNGVEPEWDDDDERFATWCEGRTGFPLVDAGMRQLAATGWMHNRVRMVTASFLTKDLHLDWRRGERWFARHLIDYDPCVNNGNWQWAASTGADAQPYFRIFNPWSQQERFDPECGYIRRWVPELRDLVPAAIHRLARERPEGLGYPEPIVDHRRESARAKRLYEAAAKR